MTNTKIILSTETVDKLRDIKEEISNIVDFNAKLVLKTDDTLRARTNYKIFGYATDLEEEMESIILRSDCVTRNELSDISEKVFNLACLANIQNIHQPDDVDKTISDKLLNMSIEIDDIIRNLKRNLVN